MIPAAKLAGKTLEIAGNFAGIPGLGLASIVVEQITDGCEKVGAHKRKSKRLVNKCALLLSALEEELKTSKLAETEAAQKIDELVATLEKVNKRVTKWAQYNRVTCFLRRGDIEKGLVTCESEIDTAMSLYTIDFNALLYHAQHEEAAASKYRQHELMERFEQVEQLLTNRDDLRLISQRQRSGEHVAEPIMEAGQMGLRQLREIAHPNREFPGTWFDGSSSSVQPRDSTRYLEMQRGLMELHRMTGIPPTVKILNGEVIKDGDMALRGGVYSDVWLGRWLGVEKVALKALRNIKVADPKAKKRFEREIQIWSTLDNERILPFYGVVTSLGPNVCVVSAWQENGNVLEYTAKFPEVNKLQLLLDAAKGLEYLHNRGIVHGNVKCSNMLVSSEGKACICDFGMSKVVEDVTEVSASVTLANTSSVDFLAPELIEGTISSPTKRADTYSYAMAILELLTMKRPWAHIKRHAVIVKTIVELKETPPRPLDGEAMRWLTDELWELMIQCWANAEDERPVMTQVLARMELIEGNQPKHDA